MLFPEKPKSIWQKARARPVTLVQSTGLGTEGGLGFRVGFPAEFFCQGVPGPRPVPRTICAEPAGTRRGRPTLVCNHARSNRPLQMERLATANLELWQSASAARGELEALRGQVELVQGNIRSGVSENSRLQMELNCLRQSLQVRSLAPSGGKGGEGGGANGHRSAYPP
jgi:hypothetical protein